MSYDGGAGDLRGRLVGGRYRLLERIGTGSVWRARDERTQREVAVRRPRPALGPQEDGYRRAARRLLHETRAAARVTHPCAVPVHDVVVEGELPWVVMELVPGESLRELLARGPVPPGEAARIGLAVLGALRAAHSVGIVHRNVEPARVLLGPGGRVVLTGFGVETSAGGGEFQAPERRAGRGGGPACDLFSLGALLRAAVAGDEGPLRPLLARLLSPEPQRRPDAQETAAALEAVARPTEGGPEPRMEEDAPFAP